MTQMIKNLLLLFSFALLYACNGQQGGEPVAKTGGTPVTGIENGAPVIFQDSKNIYWFCGWKKGLYRYDGKSLLLFTENDGLVNHAIVGVQEDKEGNIYFDTTYGISKYDGKSFTTLPIASDSNQHAWVLNPDDLWFRMGWDSPGPFRFDGDSLYPLVFPKSPEEDNFKATYPNASFNPYGVYSTFRDSKGALWFGTSSLGLCRFDGEKVSWLVEQQLTETPEGGAFGIRSIIEDPQGYFWFCNTRERFKILADSTSAEGISLLTYQKEAGVGFTHAEGEVGFPYFMTMLTGNEGDLWMATYEQGVFRSDGEKLIHYPVKSGGKQVLLFSMYKDRQGSLWLGTHEDGVYRFNGTAFEKFSL